MTGGAERAVLNLSSELVKRGHRVTIATYDKFSGAPFYSFDKRVRIVNLNSSAVSLEGAATAASMRSRDKKKKRYITRVLKDGLSIARCLSPLNERYLRRKEAREYAAFANFVSKEKPNCLIGFMVDTNRVVGRCSHDLGLPSILALRNDPRLDFKCSHESVLQRINGRKAIRDLTLHSKVAVLVPPFASELRKLASISAAVVPNFIDIENFSTAYQIPLESREKVVLFVGRLTNVKRPLQLLEAFSLVAGKYPDWKLKIVGEGLLEQPLRSKIAEYSLSSQVIMAGITSNVEEHYTGARILCQPSQYEGFSQVLGEAMASGLPCIGDAKCLSSSYLLSEGRGLLFDEEDLVHALACGLDKMMSSPELRKHYSSRSYEFICGHSPEKITDKWEQLISETCDAS